MKVVYTSILMYIGSISSFLAQFQTQEVALSYEGYKGTAEVCMNCQSLALATNKSYYWVENGRLGESEGRFKGQLLHGSLVLYKDRFEGREMFLEGNYYTGLKDGIIKTYLPESVLDKKEQYEKGVVLSRAFYRGEEEIAANTLVRQFDYQKHLPDKSLLTFTFFGPQSKIVAAGYQVYTPSYFSNFYEGTYKKFFKDQAGNEYLKEEGQYVKNRRQGKWQVHYADGVVAHLTYTQDLLVTEEFLRNGQPFTGTVRDLSPNKTTEVALIAVKEGKRNGKTLDSFGPTQDKQNKPNRVITYTEGKADTLLSLQDFLRTQTITRTLEVGKQCDARGADLYIDRIQYTSQGALVYLHHFYDSPTGATSLIYTAPPDDSTSFKAIEVATRQLFPLQKIFGLPVTPAYQITYNGQITSFVLFFQGMRPIHKHLSFIESRINELRTTNEQQAGTSAWGCYEILLE